MEWCLTKDDNVVTVTVNLLLTFSCWSLVSESNKRIALQENASNMRRATSLRADGNCVFARPIYGFGNWWRFLLFFIPGVFRVFPSVDMYCNRCFFVVKKVKFCN